MTEKEIVKLTKGLFSKYNRIKNSNLYVIEEKKYWLEIEEIKLKLSKYVSMGVSKYLTKQMLIQLISVQSSLRFMSEHTFYIYILQPFEKELI